MKDVDKVAGEVEKFISKETDLMPYAEDNDLIPIKLDKNNFQELKLFGEGKIWAIDGGNACLLSAPNFSLDVVRTAAVSYEGTKKEKEIVKEFFCLVKAVNERGKKKYTITIIGEDIFTEDLKFDADAKTLDGENYKMEIDSVAGIVRRLAELKLAANMADLNKNIVIDGSIKCKFSMELDLVKELSGKKANIGFLSKTSRLLTKNSSSLNSVLNEIGPKSSWYYHPVYEINSSNYPGDMYFVKLNSKSEHVFKLDLFDNTKRDEFILSLSKNSDDPVFFGYPYCLIGADKAARVSNAEKEYLRVVVLSKIKNRKRLEYLMSNLNAHDILDNIN